MGDMVTTGEGAVGMMMVMIFSLFTQVKEYKFHIKYSSVGKSPDNSGEESNFFVATVSLALDSC